MTDDHNEVEGLLEYQRMARIALGVQAWYIDEQEAKIKALMDTLERIAHVSDIYGVEARAEDQGAGTLAYAHKSTCNLARAALTQVEGKQNE